ncbi:MAG TPA: mechanosensitive ion channel family protein [Acidimicrobiia bacterium]|nr:mechanosensitive ion channel family protein [Acidimicrobiia bacterium]
MTATLTTLLMAQAAPDPGLADACGDAPGIVCKLLYDLTGNGTLARVIEWVVAKPLKMLLVIVIAFFLVRLLRRLIRRLVDRLVAQRAAQARAMEEELSGERAGTRGERAAAKARRLAEQRERGKQRAQALGTLLRSLVSVVVWGATALIVLGEFGVNLGPLLAGAGIAGIALGFGAQTLVRDFLSGMFMLAEDQYGIGDVIDVGDASGVVEEVRLRTTRLRDLNGNVWFFPNGEIRRVANKSQHWSRAVLDIAVAYETDLDLATRVIKEAADSVWRESAAGATVLEEPQILGVEDLGDSAVTIRLVLKVEPGEQWAVARLARRRIKDALDAAGVEIPFPQRAVWVHFAEPEAAAASAAG